MHWLKENWFKIILSIVTLAVAVSAVYYFVVLPKEKFEYQRQQDLEKKNAELDKIFVQEEKSKLNESSRSLCLSVAEDKYNADFKLNSYPAKGAEEGTRTWVSYQVRDVVTQDYQNAQNNCYKKYPIY